MGYLVRLALIIGAAALFAGCGGSQSPIGAPGAMPQSRPVTPTSSGYRVLYSFRGGSDGELPYGNLTDVNGTLYGTTRAGGKGCITSGTAGCGTIFSITTSGHEKVLYRFGGPDGAFPTASLIDVNGKLYGTTYLGGAHDTCGSAGGGCGTVFSVTTTGNEKVLYDFAGGTDGAHPSINAALIDVNGTLYGTTNDGGTYGAGTVFSVTTTGKEKVLYSFAGGSDGAAPDSGLIDVDGTLYGTTSRGGSGCDNAGCGTFFSITPGGKEHVLHIFNGDDGGIPQGNLLWLKGTFYGTASSGPIGGTVWGIRGTGKHDLTVLHSFGYGSGPDGSFPMAGLIDVNCTLYGTTWTGGSGGGTVFGVTTSGHEQVLHTFGPRPDGILPVGSLTDMNGTLYGTTSNGGEYGSSYGTGGTVFALTPYFRACDAASRARRAGIKLPAAKPAPKAGQTLN